MNRKLLFLIGCVVVALIAGIVAFTKEKSDKLDVYGAAGDSQNILDEIGGMQGTQVTKTGTVICLPHKNASGPQTLECAIGIKEQSGKNYGVRSDDFGSVSSMQNGRKVEVSGTLYPPDSNNKYNIEGVIQANSVKQL